MYATEHVSTAMLELLVHKVSFKMMQKFFVIIPFEIPVNLIETFPAELFPDNWHSAVWVTETQFIGINWLNNNLRLALRVPSAVSPTDSNILLNPKHRDFKDLIIKNPLPIPVDVRLHKI